MATAESGFTKASTMWINALEYPQSAKLSGLVATAISSQYMDGRKAN